MPRFKRFAANCHERNTSKTGSPFVSIGEIRGQLLHTKNRRYLRHLRMVCLAADDADFHRLRKLEKSLAPSQVLNGPRVKRGFIFYGGGHLPLMPRGGYRYCYRNAAPPCFPPSFEAACVLPESLAQPLLRASLTNPDRFLGGVCC